MLLACISHQPFAADADMLTVTVCTPYGRFDVVQTTPASTSPPMCLWHIGLCTPSQRHLDALATKAGEKCRLDTVWSTDRRKTFKSAYFNAGGTFLSVVLTLGFMVKYRRFKIKHPCVIPKQLSTNFYG
jgi:hypothetical protein